MNVREEINCFSAAADRDVLLWLFGRYSMSQSWRFVATCTHARYGDQSFQTNRVWVPTDEGRALYAHMTDVPVPVAEQRDLLVEAERQLSHDDFGIPLEDGDSKLLDSIRAHLQKVAQPEVQEVGMRAGLLFKLTSFWVGVHYSKADRRFCINLVPCLTLWVALPGGNVPCV